MKNKINGTEISKFFWGRMPPDPPLKACALAHANAWTIAPTLILGSCQTCPQQAPGGDPGLFDIILTPWKVHTETWIKPERRPITVPITPEDKSNSHQGLMATFATKAEIWKYERKFSKLPKPHRTGNHWKALDEILPMVVLVLSFGEFLRNLVIFWKYVVLNGLKSSPSAIDRSVVPICEWKS